MQRLTESRADLFGEVPEKNKTLPEQYILLVECSDEKELVELWREMTRRNQKCRMLMS